MEDEHKDDSEVLETTEETSEETTTEETTTETEEKETLTPEEIAALKAKAAKADDLESKNKQLFERAKKAEARAPGDLSVRDAAALQQAQVPMEDWDDVIEYAKFKKLPIQEALKSGVVKTMLVDKAEERRTAIATETGRQARGTPNTSDADILRRAERGEELKTEEDMQAAFRARLNSKKNKK